MTVREALTRACASIDRKDAELLLLHALSDEQRDRPWLFAHPEAELTPQQLRAFEDFVDRRSAHEPVQFITGHQEFFGLDFHVSPDVLIPRPETELLVEAVLRWARDREPTAAQDSPLRLVDVGTGSGAIAVALAAQLPDALITALDISPTALAVAKANAIRLGYSSRLSFLHSDLLAALEPEIAAGLRFDAVVSNPPYVPLSEAPGLQREVRDFEPHTALFAGHDGLDIYRTLIPQAFAALRPQGLLAMEFGFGQQPAMAGLLDGWNNLRFLDDLAGIPRIALADRP